MAGRIRSVLGKIGAWLKGRPKPPSLPSRPSIPAAGHRGIAAGNLAERHRANEEFLEGTRPTGPYSQEEIDRWGTIGGPEAEGFILNQEPLVVNSSNVAMGQYFIEDRKLMIEYLDGSAYMYENISPEEASLFVTMQSKGSFIWDVLWVRGSKTAHRKPFVKIR